MTRHFGTQWITETLQRMLWGTIYNGHNNNNLLDPQYNTQHIKVYVRQVTKLAYFLVSWQYWQTVCRVTKISRFFGRPYLGRAYVTACRLSSSSVTFCIVAKRHILAKNCLKEQIGLPPETTPRYQFGPPIPPLMGIILYKLKDSACFRKAVCDVRNTWRYVTWQYIAYTVNKHRLQCNNETETSRNI